MIRVGAIIAILGVVCLVAFRMIGSSVGPDGALNEPFGLIPIGYALMFLGMVLAVIGWARNMLRRRGGH